MYEVQTIERTIKIGQLKVKTLWEAIYTLTI